jgi:hypothetical protein
LFLYQKAVSANKQDIFRLVEQSNYSTMADIYSHLDYKAQEQSTQTIQQILG